MNKKVLWIIVVTLFFICILIGIQYGRITPKTSDRQVFFAMDTFFEVQSTEIQDWDIIMKQIQDCILNLDNKLNSYVEDSEIYSVNQNASLAPVKVSDETFLVIKQAIEFGQMSNGLFDITFQPLLDLYGFETGEYKVPAVEVINETKNLVGYSLIQMNEKDRTIFLPKLGMKLNLSGLIKGIVLDRVSELLNSQGITEFALNFGGNLYIKSEKEEEIGIKSPTKSFIIKTIPLKKGFVSTSSNGEQYFIKDGTRYSHIINPITGSAVSSVDSVTVLSDSGLISDFLSTYLYLLPLERITDFMQYHFPNEGFAIIQNEKIVLEKKKNP